MFTSDLEDQPTSVNGKREQILQGAMRVFLHYGYAKTSMDRVATTAGVSKQTIYSHFQDKEGLFTALIERVTIRRFQIELGLESYQTTSTLPLQGEPALLLRKLAEIFLHKMSDEEYLSFIRLVIAESARFPQLAKLYSCTVIQRGCQSLSHYFQAHPELNIPDTEATARIFLGSLMSFVLSQEILHGKHTMPIAKERFIKSLIHLVMGHATGMEE
jgi:AcrR family transcriptional regulator